MDLSLDDIIKMKKQTGVSQQNDPKGIRNGHQSHFNLQKLKELGARSGVIHRRTPSETRRSLDLKPSNKLRISNLHPGVDDNDIRDLFQEIGPIRKAAMFRNSAGKSLGVAEVVYHNAQDMMKAVNTYHTRTLDGQKMSVTIVSGSEARFKKSEPSILSRLGINPDDDIRKVFKKGSESSKIKKRNGNKKAKRNRDREEPMTVEELDADIEAYRQSKIGLI